ncbi:MAG: FGGY-family carbohydrate kinase [Lachnospiraceae bacterium]|nr:FGGY-family carbohydrate kinase [Lachnospiraceae bacterium]
MGEIKDSILNGKTYLGIELGSTRIKGVLIDESYAPIAQGSHEWENRYENGVWTYSLDDIWTGLQDCYADLAADVLNKYGVELTTVGSIGFSAMMHGYMAFNDQGKLLVPFRTWRNSMQEAASTKLTEVFDFHIPQRWSIAHLYQSILNNEEHVKDITFFTTLAGYIHWQLTGNKTLGVGEASGMFPIDQATGQFNTEMIAKFDDLVADKGYPWKLKDILPDVSSAGVQAGTLTEDGASKLDPRGILKAGIPLCPPEGDAGTGMTATNAVKQRTGNVSAGTSVFSMVVLEKDLSKPYEEIDIVTTPTGDPVAMVHCNNCTSDINAWVNIFKQFAECFGVGLDANKLYGTLFNIAMEGDSDCGGLLSYNYISGENITGFEEGRPMFIRTPNANFTLANFMRTHLFSALAALKIGNDILFKEENVGVDRITGHGGFFKTPGVGQKIMAAALGAPVTCMETAGEGGPWGMALLAAYMMQKQDNETLGDFLENKVFKGESGTTVTPDIADTNGFSRFMKNYNLGLSAQRAAVDNIK